MSDNRQSKRKRSGAESRKAKKARQHENKQLSSFMTQYIQHEDESNVPEAKTDLRSDAEGGGNCERDMPGLPGPGALELDTLTFEDEQGSPVAVNQGEEGLIVEVHQDVENLLEVEETAETTLQEQEYVEEPLTVEEPNQCRAFLSNPRIVVDEVSGTFDPASVVGLKLSTEEKAKLIKMKPCQPNQSTLKLRKKQFGERYRYCSQQVFSHDDHTRRKWISYSLSTDSLFCIPCLLFTDALSRGEFIRANQGNTFTSTGFSNWKKQQGVDKHEMSAAHANAKVAEVLFLQDRNIASCLGKQEQEEAARKKMEVISNRNVMTRVVDCVMFLGKQGLAFRGHRESLASELLNTGNFLEVLKLLSAYDITIRDHLEKVRKQHEADVATVGQRSVAVKGRGSKLTFLSNKTQNNVIDVIGKEITSEIVKRVQECKAWALIADTTPDVSHHEQLSICVRIVDRVGHCSEHLLCCKRASGTTAQELYTTIVEALKSEGVSFDKLVAQTYDGASNMSGCYNGLQAIMKDAIGSHVVYTHCYAHTLNLVLSDSAGTAINVISLFSNLEKTYTLFSQSEKIHSMFESIQKDQQLKVLALKRINTVRWHSREFSLKVFLSRYDCVMKVLGEVAAESSFSVNQRATAEGLLAPFQSKQIIATACLFREIFVITGPLSRYLQSVNVDLGKALAMVDSSLSRLQSLRSDPDKIIQISDKDCGTVEWKERRVRRRRVMDGEIARDEPEETPLAEWKRETFHVAVDTIINSMKNRFEKNRPLLQSLAMFSPSGFPELVKNIQTAHDLEAKISSFCTTYNINTSRCAEELFTFAPSFQMLNRSIFANESKEDGSNFPQKYDENDADLDSDDHDDNRDEVTSANEKARDKDVPSFLEALNILLHPNYHLIDAYPTLCKVYAISVGIPISSATAERSFSALKRVKTRIRSSMLQGRLEALLLMAVERDILLSLDKVRIIDVFAKTSTELSKALF